MDSNISTYKLQLSQIQAEINNCQDDNKKSSLLQLESSLKELIRITSDLDSENLDAEYQLFKAELESEDEKDKADNAVDDLQDDLSSLPGMKCCAPFKHSWSDEPVFHNALIFKVEEQEEVGCADDILVRVMFTNPTHNDMKPCPYFLESDCKFSDEKCRFSHGEVVPFVSIKEYREPNFSKLKIGASVLMKETDGLWYRANILSVSEEKCLVKKESYTAEEEVDLHDLFPLESHSEGNAEGDSSDEEDNCDQHFDASSSEIIPMIPSSNALGGWEQYTKGFGSKMMLKMGYIFGGGLGVNADGRIEPVSAVVYPAGKSLDHCMMLKEKSGCDQDLFKAERKVRKMQRRHEEALKKSYERESERRNIFTFINNSICRSENDVLLDKSKVSQRELQHKSLKGLNITSLQISQDVKKVQQEKEKLNESLIRNSTSSVAYSNIREKIRECDDKLLKLEFSEKKISIELQQRSDRKKLTVF